MKLKIDNIMDDKNLNKTQKDFITKMENLIDKIDMDIKVSKRKRVLNKVIKELKIDK